tara:strand:+ start:273 stop:866 length:594 start_codon:yes stop_codon:yes gene_type:complete
MHWQTIFRIKRKAPVIMNHWLIVVCLAVSAPASSWPELIPDNSDDSPNRVLAAQESVQSTAPQTFYQNEVDDGLQSACLACHRKGAVASQSGARLVLSTDALANHQAFTGFLALDDTAGDWVLAKVAGQEGHGGGAVLTPSSPTYLALQQYLTMLDALTESEQSDDAFWEGTAAEPRDVTLRRVALLLAGQIPVPRH